MANRNTAGFGLQAVMRVGNFLIALYYTMRYTIRSGPLSRPYSNWPY